MTVENQNLEMYAGDTKIVTISITDDAGDPKDLTGADLWFKATDGSDHEIEKSLVDGVQTGIELGSLGQAILTLDPADTEDLEGNFNHYVRAKDVSGNEGVVTKGTVRIKPLLP